MTVTAAVYTGKEKSSVKLKTDLVEAAMKDFFNLGSFEGDGLEVSSVVIVEEFQVSFRICRKRTEHVCNVNVELFIQHNRFIPWGRFSNQQYKI